MRPRVREFVGIVARTLPIYEPIYEFGSLIVGHSRADLRPIFPGKEYIGCDMRPGRGVDRILNLHDIDLPDETAGTVLCLDTLEHVEFCRKAVLEMHRILKPGGICVISSVMDYKIHNHPSDYWRFTPAAFESILEPFPEKYVGYQGEPKFPNIILGIGVKGPVNWEPFLTMWLK